MMWERVTIDDKPNFISRAQFRGVENQGMAICRQVPDQAEWLVSLEYILDNSLDEHNATYPETQVHLAVLRDMMAQTKGEASPATASVPSEVLGVLNQTIRAYHREQGWTIEYSIACAWLAQQHAPSEDT